MTSRRPFIITTVSVFLLAAFCVLPSALGQTATATLSGNVEDEKGAVVPGVIVAVLNVDTLFRRETTTNDGGSFVLSLLPPGHYSLTAERQGFKIMQISSVVLNVGDQKALNIQLQTGNITETVRVAGEAPLINESPTVGTVIDRQFVGNLPLNGRSFQSLITLSPGIVLTRAGQGEQGQFSVNGQRANANYFTVDGVSANVGGGLNLSIASGQQLSGALPGLTAAGGTNSLVSVDALQEFKILTSTYAPEFGRSPGAQVSLITRSGTNEFHGAVFEYFRNDALDANDWFANANSLRKPALRQNNFGGVLGGPLFLPRFGEGGPYIYKGRDRTFFFFSYEGLRLRQPQVGIMDVPSLSFRQSAVPTVRPLLNAFPVPNGPVSANGFAKFSATFSNPLTLNATSFRIDHIVNNKLTVFGRYNYAPSDVAQRGGTVSLNTVLTNAFNTNTLTLGSTQVITPNITNDLRVNYTENKGSSSVLIDNFGGAVVPPENFFFPHPALRQSASQIGISGGVASFLLVGTRGSNLQRQVNIVDNLSAVAGAHQLKFGIDYRRLSPVIGQALTTSLGATFTNVASAATGIASAVSVSSQPSRLFPLFHNLSLYGQDTWRVTPRFVLTYGLRWEYNPPMTEKNGNIPFAVIGTDNLSTLDLAPSGTPLYETTYNNFAPRIGLAYHLRQTQGRETVVRGSFGLFYDLGSGTSANALLGYPFRASRILRNVGFPLSFENATPPTVNTNPPFDAIIAVDPRLKLPYAYQWNVSFEQSLGTGQTLTASYVAALGQRLLRQERLVNPNPRFTSVSITRNSAESDYHALQLQFQRRLSGGLQALVTYTWSHSIDSASNDSTVLTPSERIAPQLDRGPSDFDVRHALSGAVTYDLPTLSAGQAGKFIFRGWSVDTIFTARSATPVDITYSRDIGFGTFSFRPDLVPGIPLYLGDPAAPGGRRFNDTRVQVPGNPNPQIGPFLRPVQARQGNLERNALRGFPVWQVDLALRRQFNLTEKVNMQLRAEFFNLFNHPNFADPVGILTSSQFGLSTSMFGRSLGSSGLSGFNALYQIGGPRSIQMSLRLQF